MNRFENNVFDRSFIVGMPYGMLQFFPTTRINFSKAQNNKIITLTFLLLCFFFSVFSLSANSNPLEKYNSKIGNFIWEDYNKDGTLDLGEPGLESVMILLFDAQTNELIQETLSDENGFYDFQNVWIGEYFLVFDPSLNNAGKNYANNGQSLIDGLYVTDIFCYDPSRGNDLNHDIGFYPFCQKIKAIEDQLIHKGQQIELSVSGGVNYKWSPAYGLTCTDCAEPIAKPNHSIYYIVESVDANYCIQYDTVFVEVRPRLSAIENELNEKPTLSLSVAVNSDIALYPNNIFKTQTEDICDDFMEENFDVFVINNPDEKIDYYLNIPYADRMNWEVKVNNLPVSNVFSSCNSGKGTLISLNQGEHHLMLKDEMMCEYNMEIIVPFISTDTLNVTIDVAEQKTICIKTDQLPGNIMAATNIVNDEFSEYVVFEKMNDDNCLRGKGLKTGITQTRVVICDDYVICDTTYVILNIVDGKKNVEEKFPELISDEMTTKEGETINLYPFNNDKLNGEIDTFYMVDKPRNGYANFNFDGSLFYMPNKNYCDIQVPEYFTYALCNEIGCDTASISVVVSCKSLSFFSGISPNDDGENDVFIIDGIQDFPKNKLSIFSRWGTLLFSNEEYKNDWGGVWNGEVLPKGTYYYVFDTGEGDTYSGYLQLNR